STWTILRWGWGADMRRADGSVWWAGGGRRMLATHRPVPSGNAHEHDAIRGTPGLVPGRGRIAVAVEPARPLDVLVAVHDVARAAGGPAGGAARIVRGDAGLGLGGLRP